MSFKVQAFNMCQFKSLLIDLIYQGGHGLWFISPSCRKEKLDWNTKGTSCASPPALSTLSKVPIGATAQRDTCSTIKARPWGCRWRNRWSLWTLGRSSDKFSDALAIWSWRGTENSVIDHWKNPKKEPKVANIFKSNGGAGMAARVPQKHHKKEPIANICNGGEQPPTGMAAGDDEEGGRGSLDKVEEEKGRKRV